MVDGYLSRLLPRLRQRTSSRTPGPTGRLTGPPTSSNGASSFHLTWEVPPEPLVEVRADLEVLTPPTVDRLYFWALQVSFTDRVGVERGGAHTGLQHHPSYPGAGAVNWGGYHAGGGELDGSTSDLPSTLNNANTRDYRWRPGTGYRFRVFAAPGRDDRWRASVTDLTSGAETVIRDLDVKANSLTRPMVWSEVFADCDHPSCTVRWSNLEADLAKGGTVKATSVRLNYQRHDDGGCANTTTHLDPSGNGFLQITSTGRVHTTGTTLTLR